MSWSKYSYVRLTIRLDGKNDVKTYRFDSKEDIDQLEKDMAILLPKMRDAFDELEVQRLH